MACAFSLFAASSKANRVLLSAKNGEAISCRHAVFSLSEKAMKTTLNSHNRMSVAALNLPAPLLRSVRTILVPLDVDNRAAELLLAAASFARQLEASLVLLHVYELKNHAPIGTSPLHMQIWLGAMQKMAVKQMAKFLTRFEDDPTIRNARTMVVSGFIEEEVARAAEGVRADLILISSHAHTGLKRFFLGSKAELIMRHGGCPVLIVPIPHVPSRTKTIPLAHAGA